MHLKLVIYIQIMLILSLHAHASGKRAVDEPLSRVDINMPSKLAGALKLAHSGKLSEATAELNKWEPQENYQKEYKTYWGNIWGADLDKVWNQYRELKSQKKMLRVRLDLFNKVILASEEENKNRKTLTDALIKKEAPIILKQLSGTSEGEAVETNYLKWIQRNKYYSVVCGRERRRWVTQPDIELTEIQQGLSTCPLKLEDFLLRVRRLIFAAREDQAQKEIKAYIESEKALKLFEKAYVQAVFDSNVGDPLAAFESLIPHEEDLIKSDYAENYFYIAQRAGELEKAEVIVNKIIKNYKENNKNTNELYFQMAFLFYQNAQYAKAVEVFDRLYTKPTLREKKNRKRRVARQEQIGWLRAWALYLNNDIDKALIAFNETKDYTSDPSRLSYWIAMCYQRLDQPLTAMELFKKSSETISNNQTFSYYNLMSWLRYNDLKKKNTDLEKNGLIKDLLLVSKDRHSMFPIPSEQVTRDEINKLYSFILAETGGEDQNPIAVANDENEVIFSDENAGIVVETESELKRHIGWSQFLITNNQPELAKWHLYELEKNLRFSKNSKALIQFYAEQSFYYRALSLAQQQRANRMSFDSDIFLLRSIYPEAYKDDVSKYAKKRKIDPYLIWSIMKAETQYKSDAISPVGAVGLMQFMPYTLEKLTKLIGNNTQVEELFEPYKSIQYGASYLKKLSLELDKQVPLMAAAYNGGPHRVKSWIQRWGNVDYDVFVEHIPFAETRTYVKRVITFRSTYDKIYQKKMNIADLNYLLQPQPIKIQGPIALNEEWEPFSKKMKETN